MFTLASQQDNCRTFAELTLIVPDSAYPYAFVYIRQTAIHLRNAIISKNRQVGVRAGILFLIINFS